ncbi:MAG: hypothetical protein ACLVKE_07065 [Clostridium baratii]
MKFTKKGLLLKTMAVVFVISLLTPFGIMKSYADTQTPEPSITAKYAITMDLKTG